MLKKRNQKGFTLIEIIAVLVILGILAAVAIPKYFDLQNEAKGRALSGAVAALQSSASMEYSKGLLNSMYNATNGPTAQTTDLVVGDYSGTWTAGTTSGIMVTVTNGPTGWGDAPSTYSRNKTFNLY